MFAQITILFVFYLHQSNGLPLEETADTPYFTNSLESSGILPTDNALKTHYMQYFAGSRIVGGVDAPEGYSNYMLAMVSGVHVRMLVCGGSIITNHHVLSAAHCIEPFVIWGELSSSLKGVVGSNYWNSPNTIIEFSGYKTHPEWSWKTLKNDIGVLYTAEEIQFNDRVGRIALNYNHVGSGQMAFVTGWGRLAAMGEIPYKLQLLYKQTLTPAECIRRIASAEDIMGPMPPVDPELEICTFRAKGQGMCNGDSGSALVLARSRQQIGIVTWGIPCAMGYPDIFVRIGAFKEFITEAIKK